MMKVSRHACHYLRMVGLPVLLCLAWPAAAAEYQSHASIYSAAKRFMQQQVAASHHRNAKISVGKLDTRFRVKRCEKPLQTYLPNGSRQIGKTTVGIKCSGHRPWSLTLPVTVSVYRNVLVSTRQLNRGEQLKPGDVKLASRDLATLPYGYVDDLAASIGMKIKRRINAGTALTPAMLKKPQVVSRGQRITILADTGAMQVRMAGKALASGAVGDRIQVLNTRSKRKLEGVITAAGEIRVAL